MLTVVLATHNGADTLPIMLDAFTRLEAPEGGWKLIAVDNASTDGTPGILESFKHRLPLEILHQHVPGKNNALNMALDHLEGDLVVFTDDDVVPDPDWLQAYVLAARAQPEVTIFAGQVRHYWQKEPPKWLECLAAEGNSYAGTASDREAGPIQAALIKGPNFAVRRSTFEEDRFDAGIGPNGAKNYAAGSETQLVLTLERKGHQAWYVPEACVQHIVRDDQIGVWPVLQRYFRIGRGMEATAGAGKSFSEDLPTIAGYPRFLYRKLPLQVVRAGGHFLRLDPYHGVRTLMDVAVSCGRAYQWRRAKREPS